MSIEITNILVDVWFQRLDSVVAEKRILIIAEAYADARVREALEEAAEIADQYNDFSTYDAIRALIPKEK